MPNTYTQLYYQIVFAVKGRRNFIQEPFREELQKYMSGIIANNDQKLYAIYCMPDHTHIFLSMRPTMCVSDITGKVKASSSNFLKNQNLVSRSFAWQDGFGAFTYSKSQADKVVKYVLNQKEHHKKKTFRQEYIEFLEKFGVNYDEKYLFEFYD